MFHICAACLVSAAAVFGAVFCAKNTDRQKEKILFCCGILMLVSEIWKQRFCYVFVNGGAFRWWYFPFQLCSMPMYVCLILPLVKRKEPFEQFLMTYGVTAALLALVYPQDMLRKWMSLTVHGFAWHGLMLYEGFLCMTMHKAQRESFARTAGLFALMAAMAEVLNITAVHLCADPSRYPDFFYINPYTETYQPVFRTIAEVCGRGAEIVIYLCILTAVCYGLFCALRRIRRE